MIPDASAGAEHRFTVQITGNFERACTPSIFIENPADYGGCFGVNFTEAPFRLAILAEPLNYPVAVCGPGNIPPSQNPALQASMRLLRQVLQVKRAHRALQADMKLRDFPLGQSDDSGAGKGGLLIEAGDMFLVSGYAVQALRQYDIDGSRSDGREQLLIVGAV